MADPNTILNLINQFPAVTLGELENSPSMNRVDVKYVIPSGLLPDLLEHMKDKFRILDIGNTRLFPYESTYFDTSDFLFYHQHMTGKLQRYKVRYRKYVSTGTGFLEVKTTTNKKRTVKRRISFNEQPDLLHDQSAAEFLMNNIPVPAGFLKPSVVSRFSRITLTGLSLNERITIDSGLSFSGTNGVCTSLPFISVIELKKERSESTSELTGILKNFSLRQHGFSKYCYGAAQVHDLPRKNLLKSKILLINKIENEHIRYAVAGK